MHTTHCDTQQHQINESHCNKWEVTRKKNEEFPTVTVMVDTCCIGLTQVI